MVLVSAFLAWRQAEAERIDGQYLTFADKERGERLMSDIVENKYV